MQLTWLSGNGEYPQSQQQNPFYDRLPWFVYGVPIKKYDGVAQRRRCTSMLFGPAEGVLGMLDRQAFS
jgi:hypothetical protein